MLVEELENGDDELGNVANAVVVAVFSVSDGSRRHVRKAPILRVVVQGCSRSACRARRSRLEVRSVQPPDPECVPSTRQRGFAADFAAAKLRLVVEVDGAQAALLVPPSRWRGCT